MNSEITDDIVIAVLRDILAKLTDIHHAINGLSLRADDVAVDLAWSRLAAAKVSDGAPAGTRADAAVTP